MLKFCKFFLVFFLFSILAFFALIAILPKPILLQNLSFSKAIYDDRHELLYLTLTKDDKYRLYTPLAEIPKNLREATLIQEDQYFYRHFGVNPFSLLRAGWKTYAVGQRRLGASTITMQVARMRFQINSKTITGKILQLFRAIQIECYYSKDQILEAYLNLGSYGSNIEGVAAASLVYFNQPIQKLPLPQVLTLVVIPQNPLRKFPSVKNQFELQASRTVLFKKWVSIHPEDINIKPFINLPLQLTKPNLPFKAPHYIMYLVQRLKNATGSQFVSSLDLKLQTILARTLERYLQQHQNVGIKNAAIMLIDVRNMQVKALIGSGDFFDAKIQGQINGTRVKRSPGSTLKPFIYALALDEGLIHPYTVLKDAPTNFGAYTPDNFDYDFLGPVKAKDALILSRNIPAIYLASQLTHPDLYDFLQTAHISNLKPESSYGLSLVLGGAEVTMEELVELYATLLNKGLWKPIRYLALDPIASGQRLLSPEASYLILDMLKDTARPQVFSQAVKSNRSPVAWKTGTSSGFRDAWTIGDFGPYVLAVWVGNFNNEANPVFIGRESASPLFFALNDAIETQLGPLPSVLANPQKLNLTQVDVCEASGGFPNAFCPHVVKTWFIPGKSPIKSDTVFREVMIDPKTGLRSCRFSPHNIFKVYEFWPSDLLKIFQTAGLKRPTPPAFDNDCNLSSVNDLGQAPHITSPQAAWIYSMPLKKSSMTIPFSVTGESDVKTFYWFVNKNFIGESPAEKSLFWQARSGNYKVRVVDDHGRSDVVDLRVKAVA